LLAATGFELIEFMRVDRTVIREMLYTITERDPNESKKVLYPNTELFILCVTNVVTLHSFGIACGIQLQLQENLTLQAVVK
jgi:hypothetical protein